MKLKYFLFLFLMGFHFYTSIIFEHFGFMIVELAPTIGLVGEKFSKKGAVWALSGVQRFTCLCVWCHKYHTNCGFGGSQSSFYIQVVVWWLFNSDVFPKLFKELGGLGSGSTQSNLYYYNLRGPWIQFQQAFNILTPHRKA